MADPVITPVSGNWQATVLLLAGASTMGKSFLVSSVLKPEYGAVCVKIDDLYTRAVTHAKILKASKAATQSEQERDARRYARDRRWPSDAAKTAFFKSYERQICRAIEKGRDAGAPVVLEGGTLIKADEIDLVVRCAEELFESDLRLVRITVRVPYKRWLQNRVTRMIASGLETAPLRKLANTTYKSEVARAQGKPHPRLVDHVVKSPIEMRALMRKLDRQST